ncbi:TPA: hypothetical protein MI429_28320 [Klebsiella pneumoniae]|nr:hypothetical protein [Klebsiella pneumoniae]HBY6386117.1 hypothetical protein [Klebsiella pneumoniae]
MWQINEVVLFDNDPYRILAIEDGQVVWMQISADKGVPQAREGANKRGNSSRLTQSFHFFMFEPIFSPVNALNQPI